MRPTGKLHLGNYFGALQNWMQIQARCRCFYMIADWHALTSDYADTSKIEDNVWEMAADWLGAGLDPARCVIFRQSWVKEHAELHLLLSMLTPVSWLERNPTYKEQLQEIKDRDLSTYGFLGYPVLQAADILIYRANGVPVGDDQLPHLELSREIARRFNYFYGPVFPEPQALLSKAPKVMGVDARKMSKSYGNAVLLSDSKQELGSKIKTMYTDPKKIRIDDKGHPEGCVVFNMHKFFTPEVQDIESRCKSGALGCVACKARLLETMNAGIEPVRESRTRWISKRKDLIDVVRAGSQNARKIARQTMEMVYKAMHLQGEM